MATLRSSDRKRTGAPLLSSTHSLVSHTRESRPDELPPSSSLIVTKDGANAPRIIAQSLLGTASLHGSHTLKRLLVVEPRTRNIGVALREEGFEGVTTALMHTSLPRDIGVTEGYDRILTDDWLPSTVRDKAGDEATRMALRERLNIYDAIIVSDLSRTLSPGQLVEALERLAHCLETHGILVLSEPAHMVNVTQLSRELLRSGLESVADPEYIAEDWPRVLMLWRKRTPTEALRSGVAQRVTWAQLAQDLPLQRQLISAYQTVFGGIEWNEWLKCVRPGCRRHYGREEALNLQPQGYCTCGWHEPLALYHPVDDILAQLYRDLTPTETSCAYLRFGEVQTATAERRVDAFAWGYITDPYRLSRTLIPVLSIDDGGEKLRELQGQLTALLQRAQTRDNPDVIYYHADLGVVEEARSLSLTRYLFERSLRFALEKGAHTVILRTSLRSPVFPLLVGLGMQPFYWYGGEAQKERWSSNRANIGASKSERYRVEQNPEIDERVVLWGEAATLVGIFSTFSDFRLAGRIARGLRKVRDEGEFR